MTSSWCPCRQPGRRRRSANSHSCTRTTPIVRLSGGRVPHGWGGRIRTCDPGTKTRCLATWPRPSTGSNRLYRSAISPSGTNFVVNPAAQRGRSCLPVCAMASSDPVSLVLNSWDSHSSPWPSAARPATLLGDDLVASPAHVVASVEAGSYVGVDIVKTDPSKEQMHGSRVLDPHLRLWPCRLSALFRPSTRSWVAEQRDGLRLQSTGC